MGRLGRRWDTWNWVSILVPANPLPFVVVCHNICRWDWPPLLFRSPYEDQNKVNAILRVFDTYVMAHYTSHPLPILYAIYQQFVRIWPLCRCNASWKVATCSSAWLEPTTAVRNIPLTSYPIFLLRLNFEQFTSACSDSDFNRYSKFSLRHRA